LVEGELLCDIESDFLKKKNKIWCGDFEDEES
jgi:hypothetical protein